VFWRAWGSTRGAESSVLGQRADPDDLVRIVELRVPEGAVATGLWGQVLGALVRAVVQESLVVNQLEAPPTVPQSVPEVPRVVPGFRQPAGPQEPSVPLLKQ